VLEHGDLSDEEKELVEDHFPITTLERLISTPAVRNLVGVEISESKLKTDLPAAEIIKPFRRMVLDLATETVNVSDLKNRDQMVAYTKALGNNLPNLQKRSGDMKPIDEWSERDFKPPPKPKPKPRPAPVRKTLIPRECYLTVSNSKIAEISKELRSLYLVDYPHAISVLFRVFMEQSVDHYLTAAGIPLEQKTPAGTKDKTLKAKVKEAIGVMVKKRG